MAKHIIHIHRTAQGIQNHPDPGGAISWLTTAWTDLGGGDIVIYWAAGPLDFVALTDALYPTSREDDVLTAYESYLKNTGDFTTTSATGYGAEDARSIFADPNNKRK
jgi:hypothetical protein